MLLIADVTNDIKHSQFLKKNRNRDELIFYYDLLVEMVTELETHQYDFIMMWICVMKLTE